jgi:hypothetical protein
MDKKTPADFNNHDEWLSYVRDDVPVTDRAYALACGRTELFKNFYKVRKQAFPVQFTNEMERIPLLDDPERTNQLESLNERIFASLTELLFNQAQPRIVEAEAVVPASPREQVAELFDHLAKKNPYFALWLAYEKATEGSSDTEEWEEYLRREFGPDSKDDISFTRAMVQLDKLLRYFRERNLPLPKYFFERTWFLHYLKEPERALQTRALLGTLAAEIEVCASA